MSPLVLTACRSVSVAVSFDLCVSLTVWSSLCMHGSDVAVDMSQHGRETRD